MVANKLLIFAVGNLRAKKNVTFLLKMVSTLLVIPMLVFWFLMAWFNQLMGFRSDSDPLGYLVKAEKP